MENKQYLDEAGLGEVGKVIKENYASKEDLSKIDVTEQLVDYAKKTDLDNKVDKVDGKSLSSNDYSNEDKAKVDAIPENPKYTDTTYDLSGYATKEDVPTKVSQLTNDKAFKTEEEIKQLINDSQKLKKEIVDSLPTNGEVDVIYLLKNKNDSNNVYTEYLWINDSWEIIGDTKVDLTDYAKKSDLNNKEEIDILAKNLQLLQRYNDADHTNPRFVRPDFSVLTGSYVLQPYRAFEALEKLYRPYISIFTEPLIGIMLVHKNPDYTDISSPKVDIRQKIFDLHNRIVLVRRTLDYKEEYNDKQICQHYTGDDFFKFCKQIRWTDWKISQEESVPFRVASPTQIGLMAIEDKKKLDSINVEQLSKPSEIVNDLTTGGTDKALSAEQGKTLNEIKAPKINTIVVASYNSSDDSKQKADYIIQENECAIQKINEYLSKLPDGGGTILLTDGDFYAKTNGAINPKQRNITIQGCGFSTHLIDNQEKRTLPFIGFTSNYCKVRDLKITFQHGNAIVVGSLGCVVQHVNINNNDTRAAIYIQKTGRQTTIFDVRVDCPKGAFIQVKGDKNTIERCYTFPSDSYTSVIQIEGRDNKIISCTVHQFVAMGSENQFVRCEAFTKGVSFYVSGNLNSFIQCHGLSSESDAFYIMNGLANRLLFCSGKTQASNGHAGFRISPNSVTNVLIGCWAVSEKNCAPFWLEGSDNQLTNCESYVNQQEVNFAIHGNGNTMSDCCGSGGTAGFLIQGTRNKVFGFQIKEPTQNAQFGCIIKGSRHIVTNGDFLSLKIDNQGTNCIVNNNFSGNDSNSRIPLPNADMEPPPSN